jgi:hypothetical protein
MIFLFGCTNSAPEAIMGCFAADYRLKKSELPSPYALSFVIFLTYFLTHKYETLIGLTFAWTSVILGVSFYFTGPKPIFLDYKRGTPFIL